jgi:hypothetical protein
MYLLLTRPRTGLYPLYPQTPRVMTVHRLHVPLVDARHLARITLSTFYMKMGPPSSYQRWYQLARLEGVTAHKTAIWIYRVFHLRDSGNGPNRSKKPVNINLNWDGFERCQSSISDAVINIRNKTKICKLQGKARCLKTGKGPLKLNILCMHEAM